MTIVEFLPTANTWISQHKELVTIVGIPLLTWLVTTVSTNSAERRSNAERRMVASEAAKDRAEERNLQRALKVSEYRRDWIEDLRREFVEILCMAKANREDEAGLLLEFDRRVQTVILMVNHKDKDIEPILEKMHDLAHAIRTNERYNPIDLSMMMRSFLKKEWQKLKSEIGEASIK
ncbi:hypothetical protein [Ruegeria sp. HKCCC2117]|uniref:hypothetical protein n=1 Tax=Ruegeria sp. HKCCC2117 TaxID=2682992 RepID=UPI001488DDBA|nr:hypothetical protein [Ruegeria sp. HKCCC2117]